MIKFFLRKIVYKKFDRESQDILITLTSKQYIIQFFCYLFWATVSILPFVPLIIINAFEKTEFCTITQRFITAFEIMYLIGLAAFCIFFKEAICAFLNLLSEKIYFLICTKMGKAISKEDFKIIKRVQERLYFFISTQMCRGYCYSICFAICKVLKKGAIEFLAVKNLVENDSEKKGKKEFTMHVLYINNGWAFDTLSSRQYQIEKLHNIYQAKIYKVFSFNEISSKSYEVFRDEKEPEIAKWAIENNCAMFWKEDKTKR